jgi:hypothetical protein
MSDWTPEGLAAEDERRREVESRGICPDSGYTIGHCWTVDLCDCAYGAPDHCPQCGIAVWDLADHER